MKSFTMHKAKGCHTKKKDFDYQKMLLLETCVLTWMFTNKLLKKESKDIQEKHRKNLINLRKSDGVKSPDCLNNF